MERSSAARFGTGIFWIFAGIMHFVIPRQYEGIVPPRIARWKKECVVVSGLAEIAGGIAVLKELKRVAVAARTPESAEEIGRHLGLGPGAVRARLRVARLLPPGTLADVPVPKRSWAQVQHDRQIAFAARTHEAQKRFGLTRAQVRAAVKRVRGLTGVC